MEAMVSGKAIISTNCGDVKLLIEDGINGFMVPTKDYKMLEEKLEILINNPEIINKFAENSFRKAKSTFSIDRVYEHTVNAYLKFRPNLKYKYKNN